MRDLDRLAYASIHLQRAVQALLLAAEQTPTAALRSELSSIGWACSKLAERTELAAELAGADEPDRTVEPLALAGH